MSRASVCGEGCLFAGLAQSTLPPCQIYRPGEQIVARDGVFVVCRGPVGVRWGEGKSYLEVLGPRDYWECPSQSSAWALGEVQGHWIEHERWLKLLCHLTVAERFMRSQHQRTQRQHEWQLVLARGSVRARVAWQLMDLARRFGERDERTGEIFVPVHLTQEQQAQLCGSVRSAVWEVLHSFTKKRWLVCGPQGFWVRDEGALQQQSRESL